MPPLRAVEKLPPEVRSAIDQQIHQRGYGDYDGLMDWIAESLPQWAEGLSRSAVARHGRGLKERMDRARRAVLMAEDYLKVFPDDGASLNAMLVNESQVQMLEMLEAGIDPDDMPKFIRAMADLTRANISQKKWAAQVRERIEAKLEELSQAEAGPRRLSPETLETIRREIYGLVR